MSAVLVCDEDKLVRVGLSLRETASNAARTHELIDKL